MPFKTELKSIKHFSASQFFSGFLLSISINSAAAADVESERSAKKKSKRSKTHRIALPIGRDEMGSEIIIFND
jgi:hypothetical protein